MYVICPVCGKIFLKELYETSINNQVKCACCDALFYAEDRQINLENPKSYKIALQRTKCKHLDTDGFPCILPTNSGYMCRICKSMVSSDEYNKILDTLERSLKEKGIIIQ